MEGPENKLTLTKLDVARRQIETAIELWFNEGDPVSAHSLAFGAHKVLRGLCNKRQMRPPLIYEQKYIKKGMEKEYFRLIHAAANFFKHSDSDASEEFEFYTGQTEFVIFDAVENYKALGAHWTDLMALFRFHFYLSHTPIWGSDATPLLNEKADVERLRGLTRKEFFEFFNPRRSS